MDFKSILKKYKDGNASLEEIKLIEEELKKYEAIEEYLSECYNVDFEKDILQEDIKKETTSVKKSVNKRLRKVILVSVSSMCLILFAIFYIVSPVLNSFYYNPSDKTVNKSCEDLYFDLKVFTELNLPGYAIGLGVTSENLGFGVHNICFDRVNLFNGATKNVNAKIKRNMRIGSFQDFFPNDALKFYTIKAPKGNNPRLLDQRNKKIINYLKELNPVSYVSASIVFQNDLTINEFDELIKKYNDKINFKWLGIRTESAGNPVHYLSGFNPNFNDGSVSDDSADKNKYPYLQLIDWVMDEDNHNKNDMVKAYTTHFTSLLRYMTDREKAVTALDHNSSKMEYYKNALNYVEKNGLNTYGVLVYGEARYLLEFLNNEKIQTVEINNVLPSKYRR